MPAFVTTILSTLGTVAGGWALKFFMSPQAWEWIILWAGKKLVEHTKTTADDEWFAEFQKIVKTGSAKEAPDAEEKK